MNYLLKILGVSIIFLLGSCGGKRVDPAVTVNYVYVNILDNPVQLILRNRASDKIKLDYTINAGDSVSFKEIDMGPAAPFSSSSIDSIVLRFSDDKCVTYVRNGNNSGTNLGTGFFNLENYIGFEKWREFAHYYKMKYEIGERDYQEAIPCF